MFLAQFSRENQNTTQQQLQRCLKCRGLKLTGKRDDLFERVNRGERGYETISFAL